MPAWLVLGSGELASRGAAPKAALLDRAKCAGLPVPDGGLLPDGAEGLPALEGSWAVRSAFHLEDGTERSYAGYFHSELRVPADSLLGAIQRVRQSASGRRADVLLLRMVEAGHAGVAFTERDFPDDLVEYTAGTAEHLLGGTQRGESVELPQTGHVHPQPFLQRLARLLARVRREFGRADWDVEWADDGVVCWLIQIRPVTRPVRRNECFTLANHKEILPDLPSRFMASLIQECAPRLFAYYRQFDPTLPERRSMIESIAGRPLLNLSLLTTLMRHWGLPTKLVTQNAGGYADRDYPMDALRMLAKWRPLLRMAVEQWQAPGRIESDAARWVARAGQPTRDLPEAVDRLGELYTALVRGMFSLTAAMSGPLALLRATGTLAEHSARHETFTTRMMRDWQRLPADEFVSQYGHRGVYESDIARPRYAESPPPAGVAAAAPAIPPRTLAGWLTLPVWWLAARPMRAREVWRDQIMRAFAMVRAELLGHAARLLPDPAHLWMLTVDEARRLSTGWRPGPAFWSERQAQIAEWESIRLPDLVRRFDDPAQWSARATSPMPDRFTGLSLTAGEVDGLAWVLSEPASSLPPGFTRERTILVARSLDAGWIPVLGLVAGAAVETGGDLSHGSLLVREMGLPAVTNLTGVMCCVHTGDRVRLKASYGLLERATDSSGVV